MKLAVSTLACSEWTLEKTIAVCSAQGIDALEIRMGIHSWSKEDLANEDFERMYDLLQKANLKVCDLATSVVVKDYDFSMLKNIERCAQIAQLLHCKGLRIMLGNFRSRWSETIPQPNRDGIIKWLQAADCIMEQYGTEIWIETHNEYAQGAVLHQLLVDANTKNCNFIWDIMHPLEAGEAIEETVSNMGGHLVHVHIKDGIHWEDADLASFCYTKLGEGCLPIKEIISLLKNKNFSGYYSLEWEVLWRKELQEKNYDAQKIISDFVRYMKSF